jgi:hypothetical protein
MRLANRLEKPRGGRLLEQVAAGAVADRLEDLVLLGVDGEHQDLHPGDPVAEQARRLGAEHARQVDVQEKHVGLCGA